MCEAKEKALQTADERAAEARARQAQLTTALQELVVFRNRTEVALLTTQDQARRLEEEVEATRKRYDAVRRHGFGWGGGTEGESTGSGGVGSGGG